MKKWFVLLVITMLVVSCVKPYKRRAEFIPEEYAPYEGAGTSSICGQVVLPTRSGDPYMAVAGDQVLLAPVTSYTREAFKIKVLQGRPLGKGDPNAARFQKLTRADEEGRFCFANIMPGSYYVVADVTLSNLNGKRQSKLAHGKATVKEDERVHIVVTR